MGLRIAIDVDDVLNRFLQHTLGKYNYVYKDDVKLEDIKSWDILKYLKCTREQLFGLWGYKFVESVPFRCGAKELIDTLRSEGHEVVLATACFAPTHERREELCLEQLGIESEDIIFIKKKYLLNVDILIDDKLSNFLDNYNMPCKFEKIVYNMPHNQNSDHLGNHYRVDKLEDVIGIVRIIEKKLRDKK